MTNLTATPNNGRKTSPRGAPPKKRQKRTEDPVTAGTRLGDTDKRQTKMRLSTFEQLPLDVLYEVSFIPPKLSVPSVTRPKIFYLCHPHALLQLSRVSEGFRRTILDPKSARIWRTTLSSIDKLPFKPPNVSLPRFMHILFDDFCFVSALLAVIACRLPEAAVLCSPTSHSIRLDGSAEDVRDVSATAVRRTHDIAYTI